MRGEGEDEKSGTRRFCLHGEEVEGDDGTKVGAATFRALLDGEGTKGEFSIATGTPTGYTLLSGTTTTSIGSALVTCLRSIYVPRYVVLCAMPLNDSIGARLKYDGTSDWSPAVGVDEDMAKFEGEKRWEKATLLFVILIPSSAASTKGLHTNISEFGSIYPHIPREHAINHNENAECSSIIHCNILKPNQWAISLLLSVFDAFLQLLSYFGCQFLEGFNNLKTVPHAHNLYIPPSPEAFWTANNDLL
jgi:hypothetical protein